MTKRAIPFLVLVTALLASPAAALNEWTVMWYMVSDDKESNSMVNSHIETINAVAPQAAKPGSYEVVIQFDAPPGFKAVDGKDADGGFRLSPNNGKWSIERLGEVNMGAPSTLWSFIRWAAEKHPARRYALFIGGHGSGIFSWRGPGGVKDPDPGRVVFDPDRFVGYDDTDDDCLTLFEVRAVLEAFKERANAGRPLDVLVLDSCMPGAVETLYQLRQVLGLLVSSPSTTLIGGMPYRKLVAGLAAEPAMAADKFGEMTAKAYLDRVVTMSNDGEVMAVYRLDKVQELAFALDQVSLALLQAMEKTGRKIGIKNLTTYGGKKRYWDLGRILRSLAEGNADFGGAQNEAAIRSLAGEAQEALRACRVTTWYSGSFADSKVSGLSIAWPEKQEFADWKPFYQALEFAKATHWDEFLTVWMGR